LADNVPFGIMAALKEVRNYNDKDQAAFVEMESQS
jgi:hypothetical protein